MFHYSLLKKILQIKLHIKKFAEIWSSCTDLFTISCIVSIVLTLCTHISFHSKDEFQICKYHEKEQLLTNGMVPSEVLLHDNSARHFHNKRTIICNTFPMGILIILIDSFISRHMFGLFWIRC